MPPVQHARVVGWYELRDDDVFECRCGWAGRFADMVNETFAELADGSCPDCDTMLVVRSFPTDADTWAAAGKWDRRAIAEIGNVVARKSRHDRAAELELRPTTELPPLTGETLRFDWDFEEDEKHESWTVVRCGDVVVHRELAYYEGYERFDDVKSILKTRFGDRFGGLHPTRESMFFLYGDNITVRVEPT